MVLYRHLTKFLNHLINCLKKLRKLLNNMLLLMLKIVNLKNIAL